MTNNIGSKPAHTTTKKSVGLASGSSDSSRTYGIVFSIMHRGFMGVSDLYSVYDERGLLFI